MISRTITTAVRCPYCELEQEIKQDVIGDNTRIVTCDVGFGGCDTDFVIRLEVEVVIYPLAISGIDRFSNEI